MTDRNLKNGYCHYCGTTNDLRPYGPKGTWVCFDCAMSTPERRAEAGLYFAVQLDAAGPVAMIDGTEVGPYPAKHAVDMALPMWQLSIDPRERSDRAPNLNG